jgi:hypothetical protein
VVCIGLDGDSDRLPFGRLLDLIPYANSVTKLTALCTRCNDGTPAPFTFRKATAAATQIQVGGTDTYEALCRKHYREGQYENRVLELYAFVSANPQVNALKILDLCISRYGLHDGTELYNNHIIPRISSPASESSS